MKVLKWVIDKIINSIFSSLYKKNKYIGIEYNKNSIIPKEYLGKCWDICIDENGEHTIVDRDDYIDKVDNNSSIISKECLEKCCENGDNYIDKVDNENYILPDITNINEGYGMLPVLDILPIDGYNLCGKIDKDEEKNIELKKEEREENMDIQLRNKVIEAIEFFSDEGLPYTSLDISNHVKNNGGQYRHRVVAEKVRELYEEDFMNSFMYTRTLIDVNLQNGNTVKAYVYHSLGSYASSYTNKSQIPIPIKFSVDTNTSTTDNDTSTTDNDTSTTDNNTNTSTTDNETQIKKHKGDCRLEIPISWVRKLNWNDGDTIYVTKCNDEIRLVHSNNVSTNDTILCPTIVSYGRLRVPKTAFNKVGFTNQAGNLKEIELEDNLIVIRRF